MKPPLARLRRPAHAFGALYARDPQGAAEAVRLNHRLIAHELMSLGFDADCAPCLDLRLPETHDVIGDRAFGSNTAEVAMLGRAALDGRTRSPAKNHSAGSALIVLGAVAAPPLK